MEIQIRTEIQDGWAQLMEAVAESFGRQIRYGHAPDMPDAPLGGGSRREFVEALMTYSMIQAKIEAALQSGGADTRKVAELLAKTRELTARFAS